MKKHAWLFSAAMTLSSLALAQTAMNSSVTEITDPARIADIERRGVQLAEAAAARTAAAPRASESKHMHKQDGRHHKGKSMHKRANKATAAPATPMATDTKK